MSVVNAVGPIDQKMVHVEHKSGMPGERATYGEGDEMPRSIDEMMDKFDDTRAKKRELIVKLKGDETVYEALKIMGKKRGGVELLSSLKGDSCCCCCTTTVEQGEIGCATKYGKTHFYGPGNYWWMGWGVVFEQKRELTVMENAGRGHQQSQFRHKDVTFFNVSEGDLAVVQLDKRQMVLGSGRYLLRSPAVLYGSVNIHSLARKEQAKTYTEQEGKVMANGRISDERKLVLIPSGSWEVQGAVTFVRAQPGFCYVVQDLQGNLRTGVGFTLCRGGEVFLEFIDRQNYARTTRAFRFESSDRQVVQVRVQLRWKLSNAKMWIKRKGAFQDIFDAIEEIAESLLRDTIAGQSNEECRQQAENGFETIEKAVKEPLAEETQDLGGVLLGMEIRELTFPLLDRRNKDRAMKDARMNERLHEAKRQLEIEIEQRKRQEADLSYSQQEEKRQIIHNTDMQKLKDKEKLDMLGANAELEKAEQNFNLQKKEGLLEAEKKQQILELQQHEQRVTARVKRNLIDEQGYADEKIQDATAAAEATKQTAKAQAYAKLTVAEAEAKAAERIGSAYRDNDYFMQLQISKMHEAVLEKRASALSRAQMLPESLQDELAVFAKAEQASKEAD